MGASGPLGHRQVLLQLFARRWLDCFGAVPAGRQFIAEAAKAWSSRSWSRKPPARPLASGHDRCAPCGTRPIHSVLRTDRSLKAFCTRSPVKPSPREPATIRTHAPPGCAPAIANYHSTFGDVDDRPGTHPLHRFGQPGVDQSKTSVRLCGTQPRATRANRAQSTAHH
jgi:hypothetical protein